MKPWPPPEGLPDGEDPFALPALEPAALDLPEVVGVAEEEAKRRAWVFDKEWGVASSVIVHLLLVLLILVLPPPKKKAEVPLAEQPDPLGLIQLLSPPPYEPPIPIQFFPAPGPAAKAPGANPLPSDADRQAHGGDPTQPKAEVPKAVAQAGIRDLAAGRPGQAAPASPAGGEGGDASSQAPPADREPGREAPGGLTQPRPLKGLSGVPGSALSALTAEQVARLAQSDGDGGDGGGGWERDGGFVDSGPLAFDTQGFEWGPYAAELVRRIKLHWDVPALARYGVKGRVTIRFFILADGRVEGITILRSSGIPPFDNAAFQAIASASPFRPLPPDLGHDREGVTVTFFYNIRPEDAARN